MILSLYAILKREIGRLLHKRNLIVKCEAPGVSKFRGWQPKRKAADWLTITAEESMWRRVNGAVIHCVAGDGFGIMTAMVIARAAGMSFWREY